MNHKLLSKAIAKKFFLTQRVSRDIITFMFSRISNDLVVGKRSHFRQFGSFKKVKHASKKVRHPRTGKIITISAKTTVDFNPSSSLLNKLN